MAYVKGSQGEKAPVKYEKDIKIQGMSINEYLSKLNKAYEVTKESDGVWFGE